MRHHAVFWYFSSFFSGLKLFSFIAQNWLKDDKIEEVKALAKYLDEDVLKDFVASSDLEVQERASVMHHFVKYVAKHLEKGDNISEDFQLFFADELNPVAPKAQKKVPIPEGLDLDAWINEPPSESEPGNFFIVFFFLSNIFRQVA